MKLLVVLLLMLGPFSAAFAAEAWQNDFARIPILHEGRVKPLGTVARVTLRSISGEETYDDKSASAWLAEVVFTPAHALEEPVFKVSAAPVRGELGLPEAEQDSYSFHALSTALAKHKQVIGSLIAKDPKSLSAQEQALLTLSENVNQMAQLLSALSLLAPVEVDAATRAALNIPPQGELSYLDMQKYKQALNEQVKALVAKKHDNLDSYTAQEQHLVQLSYQLSVMENFGQGNTLFRVIPPMWNDSKEWLSPWAVINNSEGSPATITLFNHWSALAAAYKTQDETGLQREASALRKVAGNVPGVRQSALMLEDAYHRYAPLQVSLVLYICAFMVVCGSLFSKAYIVPIARGVMIAAVLIHGLAIAMRMDILWRPPVGTLYESMLFVSFVSALFGLWLDRKRASIDGLLLGSSMAALLLVAAENFAGENDTLGVLVAVLNTNFWLATHVVCITTGYGAALAAGVLAHLVLLHRAMKRMSPVTIAAHERRLYHVALLALFFTATGTMLGGIWADQSWGRFWGWDPKENGALWIVLWLIWLLHGRIAGQLGPIAFAAAMSLITIVVALAWVGVNLLSVGLHSYGFTQAAAHGLIAFCGIEFVLIAALTLSAKYANGGAR